MARWTAVSSAQCGDDLRICEEWDTPPRYQPDCAWYERDCEICGHSMRIHRDWDNPPSVHKGCLRGDVSSFDLPAPAIRGSDPGAHRTLRHHRIIGHLLPSGRSRAISFPTLCRVGRAEALR